jgi:hypothetical protein
MSRVTRRAGYGPHRGSTNVRESFGAVPPIINKNNDKWNDTNTVPPMQKYYDSNENRFKVFGYTTYKKLSSNQITSTTNFVNINELQFSLQSNAVYSIEMNLAVYSNSNTPDIKIVWTTTGGVSQLTSRVCIGLGTTTTDHTNSVVRCSRHNLTTQVPYGVVTSGVGEVYEKFLVETTNAGWLIPQFAQWVLDASNHIGISSNSYALATRIG